MQVRAKFICQSVTKRLSSVWDEISKQSVAIHVYEAELQIVSGGSEENKKFFASSPTGRITLGVVREDHFEVGGEYYVDFTPAAGKEVSAKV